MPNENEVPLVDPDNSTSAEPIDNDCNLTTLREFIRRGYYPFFESPEPMDKSMESLIEQADLGDEKLFAEYASRPFRRTYNDKGFKKNTATSASLNSNTEQDEQCAKAAGENIARHRNSM